MTINECDLSVVHHTVQARAASVECNTILTGQSASQPAAVDDRLSGCGTTFTNNLTQLSANAMPTWTNQQLHACPFRSQCISFF